MGNEQSPDRGDDGTPAVADEDEATLDLVGNSSPAAR